LLLGRWRGHQAGRTPAARPDRRVDQARAVSLVTRGWSRSLLLQGSGSAAIEDGWLSDRGLLLAFPC